jgi:hypothetical protein
MLVCGTARASLKENIQGYKDYTFGMDLKQVVNSPGVACHTHSNYRICRVPGPEVMKLRTNVELWFFEDKLVTVDIEFVFPKDMSPSDRLGKYFELNSMLAFKYGFPDEDNDKGSNKVSDLTVGGAVFTRYWYGPGRKTSINTHMWADHSDHDICLIVTYDDVLGSQRATDAGLAERQGIKADLEKL